MLRETDGRVTQPRREVLAALLQASGPLTHAELQDQLPHLDRVSLYRVLNWLSERSLIDPLAGDDGVRRYILHHDDAAPHPHFTCDSCGKTFCLHDVEIDASPLPSGFKVARVSMLMTGTCPDC